MLDTVDLIHWRYPPALGLPNGFHEYVLAGHRLSVSAELNRSGLYELSSRGNALGLAATLGEAEQIAEQWLSAHA